ncbi:MAG: DUF4230 domain-containing protein [Flavobacteriales bacterium]|nr:DUF4230 domain-containing protein [Flavobacteriales bacterium]MBL0046428.1 DUF4230 domain-containing protein [Flavobacteriales bacterium]
MSGLSSAARIIIALGACLLVFFITREIYREAPELKTVDSTVLLERVRPVLKLVNVEGDLSELYSHQDSWRYSRLLSGLPSFQKKAMVRIKARVSVGYDLEGLKLITNEQEHIITISSPPAPQVLSIEHDIDYFDIDEGLFNSFSPQELSALNKEAKQVILDKIPQSGLLEEAAERRTEMLVVLRALVESAGWKLQVEGEAAPIAR